METFYNRSGSAVAYLDNDAKSIYLFNGLPVAWLSGDRVYGYNGRYLGWYQTGWVYDRSGHPALFTGGASAVSHRDRATYHASRRKLRAIAQGGCAPGQETTGSELLEQSLLVGRRRIGRMFIDTHSRETDRRLI